MAEGKKEASPEKSEEKAEKKPWWAEIVGQVNTPLAYFALIVVSLYLTLTAIGNLSCTAEQKYHLCLWVLGVLSFMTLVVAFMAFMRPSHLFKIERKVDALEVLVSEDLEGFFSSEAFSDSIISALRKDTDAVLDYITGPALDQLVRRTVEEQLRSLPLSNLRQLKEGNEEKRSGSQAKEEQCQQ
jgi:hypothetical protein